MDSRNILARALILQAIELDSPVALILAEHARALVGDEGIPEIAGTLHEIDCAIVLGAHAALLGESGPPANIVGANTYAAAAYQYVSGQGYLGAWSGPPVHLSLFARQLGARSACGAPVSGFAEVSEDARRVTCPECLSRLVVAQD